MSDSVWSGKRGKGKENFGRMSNGDAERDDFERSPVESRGGRKWMG